MPIDRSVVVVVPTYNEIDNLGPIVEAIRLHGVRVLVVDDGSPDGTGRLADELAEGDSAVAVLHRSTKDGLGRAYGQAFRELSEDASVEVVCQMDADFSHDPADLPRLIEAVRAGADLAIGSRYVAGGSTPDWPFHRRLLSTGGNRYANLMLGIRVRDCTAGFRAWKLARLVELDAESAEAAGYGFQVEMSRRAVDHGLRIVEIPVAFRDRQRGTSKMGPRIVLEAMVLVTRWGFARILGGRWRNGPVG